MACLNEFITSTRESKFYPSQNLHVEQNGQQLLTAMSCPDPILQWTAG